MLSTSFARALAYLSEFTDLERGGMASAALGLDRTRELLTALGDPQKNYPSILIAGTKGKGSTAAMVERALRAAGYRTGLYTQPHLHTIRERVRIDGVELSPDEFGAAMDSVRVAVDQVCSACGPTTAYEVMTSLALDRFATAKVEVAVLEVGLGGRLDSTNVVAADVSAITSISLDHTQILGSTVEAIAAEKADIIKPSRPCVSAPQPDGALRVIRRVAHERNAPLFTVGENGATWQGEALYTAAGALENLRPALLGQHQRTNAAVAATILDRLGAHGVLHVPLEAVRVGIEGVTWLGRFEIVAGAPTIILDGAHNVESAQRLRETLVERYGDSGVVFVVGIGADKDAAGIIRALTPAAGLVAVKADHPRGLDGTVIGQLAAATNIPVVVAPSVEAGLGEARARAGVGGLVVVTGSLYVVAEAREALGMAARADEGIYDPWAAR